MRLVFRARFSKLSGVSAQVREEIWRRFWPSLGGATSLGLANYSNPSYYCWHLHGVYPKPLPVRLRSCLARRVASYVQKFCRSEAAEARYRPGELETSVAAATAWRRRGCSGSPGELFAPATAPQHKLCSGWKRPTPAERSRRAERSRKDCERRARRRAARPSFMERPAVAACGDAVRR